MFVFIVCGKNKINKYGQFWLRAALQLLTSVTILDLKEHNFGKKKHNLRSYSRKTSDPNVPLLFPPDSEETPPA